MAWEIANLIAAFFVIALWSILYRDNIVYRFAEHTFVGVSIGVALVSGYRAILNGSVLPVLNGTRILAIIPLIAGIVMLFRLSYTYRWVSRYSVAVLVAVGLALWGRTSIEGQIISSLKTMLSTPLISADPLQTFTNLFLWLGLLFGTFFFLFATNVVTKRLGKAAGYISTMGRCVMMITFGGHFAATLLSMESKVIERVLFILKTVGMVP